MFSIKRLIFSLFVFAVVALFSLNTMAQDTQETQGESGKLNITKEIEKTGKNQGITTVKISSGEDSISDRDNMGSLETNTTLLSASGPWEIPDAGSMARYFTNDNFAPDGAEVTNVEYRLRIIPYTDASNFFAQDYEIYLYSSTTSEVKEDNLVYDNLGGETDGGYDDDAEDDADIYLDWRTTDYFNGERANQHWGVLIYDRFEQDKGNLDYFEFRIHWETTGEPNLIPIEISLSKDKISPGQGLLGTVRENNAGDAVAGSHETQIYLSEDNNITRSDIAIGTLYDFGEIPANETKTKEQTIELRTDLSAGTYFVGAISDIDDAVDESSEDDNNQADQTVEVITNSTVNVIEPNGGENWQKGSTHTIEWSSEEVTGLLDLRLLKNGTVVETIASDVELDGSVEWTVPTNLETSNFYRVEVIELNGAGGNDVSDDYFTISSDNQPPTIEITSGPEGTINRQDVEFTFQGDDPDGNVAHYEYQLSGDQSDEGTTQSNSKSYSNLSEGSYTFEVRAEDNEGAHSDWASKSFTVDLGNNPPLRPLVSDQVQKGNQFTVSVQVGEAANPVQNLFGTSFELTYNQSHMSYVDHELGSFLGDDLVSNVTNESSNGIVDVGMSRKSGDGGVDGHGTLLELTFDASSDISSETEVSFGLQDVTAKDPAQNNIALSPESATTTIVVGLTVWPGDMNNDSDGEVDGADVLPVGAYYGLTGPARSESDQGCEWKAYTVPRWDPPEATYADANGDGEVDGSDILCIGFNYGKTHSTNNSVVASRSGTDRSLTGEGLEYELVKTGENNYRMKLINERYTDLYGVSFDLSYQSGETKIMALQHDYDRDGYVSMTEVQNKEGRAGLGISATSDQRIGQGQVAEVHLESTAERASVALRDVTIMDDKGDTETLADEVSVSLQGTGQKQEKPRTVRLLGNYPNPFNPSTQITYQLDKRQQVALHVYSMAGKKITTLTSGIQQAGRHQVTFNADGLSSGVYIYKLITTEKILARKMLLVK